MGMVDAIRKALECERAEMKKTLGAPALGAPNREAPREKCGDAGEDDGSSVAPEGESGDQWEVR